MEMHHKIYKLSFYFIFSLIIIQGIFAAPKVSERRQKLITYSLSFVGTKYVYGGTDPETGFDCSGFIDYALKNGAGIQLPRTANEIYNSSRVLKIDPKEKEPGDLMFFKNDPNSDRVTHIGLYCGVYRGPITEFNGKRVFVSAVSDGPKTGVQLTLISERFWKNHFFGYGRILPRTKIQAQNTKTQNARVQKK